MEITWSKIIKNWNIIVFLISLFGVIAWGSVKIYFWVSEIPSIKTELAAYVKQLTGYEKGQEVMKENIRHIESKVNNIEQKVYESLIRKVFEIEFGIALDKRQEFYRQLPRSFKFKPEIQAYKGDPLDHHFNEVKKTYTDLKDKYREFLENNPEELKKIDDILESIENDYKKAKKERFYPEAGIEVTPQ